LRKPYTELSIGASYQFFFFIWQLSFRGEEFEDINQSETRIVSFFLPIKAKSAILIEDLPDDSYSY
jgi:hypothetical protein